MKVGRVGRFQMDVHLPTVKTDLKQLLNINFMTELRKIMNEENSVSSAIDVAKSFMKSLPLKPKKPILKQNHSISEVDEYRNALAIYETNLVDFERKETQIKNHNNSITEEIIDFIKEQSGLTKIDFKYQNKIYWKAYEDHHSDGFYSVYLDLCSLVEILNS